MLLQLVAVSASLKVLYFFFKIAKENARDRETERERVGGSVVSNALSVGKVQNIVEKM